MKTLYKKTIFLQKKLNFLLFYYNYIYFLFVMNTIKKVTLPVEIDDNDSISPQKPALKWLWKSVLIISIILIIGFCVFKFWTNYIIQNIDIEKEKQIFGNIFDSSDKALLDLENFESIKNHSKKEEILAKIGQVYIEDSPVENAYATLGAKIFITKKLLENSKTEEEILFIIGHEYGHIKNRDALRSATQAIPLWIIAEILGLNTGSINIEDLLQKYLSREAEFLADQSGQELLDELSLSSRCATRFFEENASGFEKYTAIISTHPDTMIRLENMKTADKHPEKSCTPYHFYSDENNSETKITE